MSSVTLVENGVTLPSVLTPPPVVEGSWKGEFFFFFIGPRYRVRTLGL